MMLRHLGIFGVLAVCLFAMLISGCPSEVQQMVVPPAEDPGTEPVTEGRTEPTEPMVPPVTPPPVPMVPPTAGPDGMVLIPAGSFEMGSNDAEADADERPVHTVHLDAFYMDVYEVTNAEFKVFVDANPGWDEPLRDLGIDLDEWGHLADWTGTDYPVGQGDHPVVNVSWYAAALYAASVGKRLPTEAEWEYAARGGLVGKKYPWGDTITAADANYDDAGGTTPVGRYAANGYGLYDMAGNVLEWCLDEYDADFYAESANSRNPIAGDFENSQLDAKRVLRGGSWRGSAGLLRVADRTQSSPLDANSFTGFRCVRDVALEF